MGNQPTFFCKKYSCRVVGVDIRAKMIDRTEERARREKVADGVEFRVADAQDLPFEDGKFDIAITEYFGFGLYVGRKN